MIKNKSLRPNRYLALQDTGQAAACNPLLVAESTGQGIRTHALDKMSAND